MHTRENHDQEYRRRVFVACAESSAYIKTCNSIVFKRFSVENRKRIKTVVRTRIDRCVFDDNDVLTGP